MRQSSGPSMHSLARRALVAFFVAIAPCAAVAACASDDAQFNVKYAPDYAKAGSVSVFGIFKDGRMSPEAWDEVGARLMKKKCDSAYGPDMVANRPTLSDSIDDYARANGITDDLLAELAPLAKGDTILVVTIAGHPAKLLQTEGGAPRAAPIVRGGGRRMRPTSVGATTVSDGNVFEMSASLYSVLQRRSVALLSMTYYGRDVEVALGRFADRLAEAIPGTPCLGWSWEATIDETKIRKMAEER